MAFKDDWEKACKAVAPGKGVDWRAAFAQGIFESGWGGNGLTKHNNNVLAMKWPVGDYPREAVGDNTEGPFAKYPSLEANVADWCDFINPANNQRYAMAWPYRREGRLLVEYLDMAGYSDGVYKRAPGDYSAGILRVWAELRLDYADPWPPAPPADQPRQVVKIVGPDGHELAQGWLMDPDGAGPEGERTVVRARELAEALGFTVAWDPAGPTVTLARKEVKRRGKRTNG